VVVVTYTIVPLYRQRQPVYFRKYNKNINCRKSLCGKDLRSRGQPAGPKPLSDKDLGKKKEAGANPRDFPTTQQQT